MTEQEKMLAGRLYSASDPFLTQQRLRARGLVREICQTPVDAGALRERLFRTLLGAAGKNLMIEPPFRCDYGSNIFIGDNFYANFDCIILDVCPVTIGTHRGARPDSSSANRFPSETTYGSEAGRSSIPASRSGTPASSEPERL